MVFNAFMGLYSNFNIVWHVNHPPNFTTDYHKLGDFRCDGRSTP